MASQSAESAPTASRDQAAILRLPDELLEAIVAHLPPTATLAFGTTNSRFNKITYEPLVWRRHCVQTWKHWEMKHELEEKLDQPPVQTKWRILYNERKKIDREALELFDQLLLTTQYRYERMEKVAKYGYDVKDLLLRLRDHTPEDAEDYLARTFHADAILGQIHRLRGIDKWQRLHNHQMVKLEEVLGAYDEFVLAGAQGDIQDIDREFNRIAQCISTEVPDFYELSPRRRAVEIAQYLRNAGLVGNNNQDEYHALRNNFLSLALFEEPHSSLPLQSVAIYCAVSRRLGLNAKLSNYPQHVHAVVTAPPGITLDGRPTRARSTSSSSTDDESDPNAGETMHMDPWRSSTEVDPQYLRARLLQMGAPSHQHIQHLSPTSTLDIALRTSRNIMTSVQSFRERHRSHANASTSHHYPDIEAAWYAMLWSMLILGDHNPRSSLHRRRQCLPYLIEHFQTHYPWDLPLIETLLPPMFANENEANVLSHLVVAHRSTDRTRKAPQHRNPRTKESVRYKIGTWMRHKRFGYEGFVVGWDATCGAEERWVEQMRVDELSRGREQGFYNVVADDKTIRYVAEENIIALPEDLSSSRTESARPTSSSAPASLAGVSTSADEGDNDSDNGMDSERGHEEDLEVAKEPSAKLMSQAGRYFWKWDQEEGRFMGGLKEEYPDD
ncbi:unnamed protein product [Zymoseptoria tritici ST99CH_1A5]|uniref:F-box domain-containing protein n=3 Tax=Zymoseptoria tritici TaxID=1047171 RepID=A0A1X7S7K7_ZYMT9|nr:unnamed protein product [Zymoseptoria tritici ST99CH_3D7]SMR60615.1 unnamed protein product [Zymoseptoria tritici ST99CH_1E4]SMY29085.1 unnamed protein product [Zymoseptoria tritici ST99CH_1A5]